MLTGGHQLYQPALARAIARHSPVRLEAEVLALRGAHDRWVAQYRRTTVGVSGLTIADAARYVAEWLRGNDPESPRAGFSAPLMLRFRDRRSEGLRP